MPETKHAAAPEESSSGAALASREGYDVTEFRRKGSVLTLQMRYRNQGSSTTLLSWRMGEVYVLDESGAKKYEVLKDEKGNYIATTIGNFNPIAVGRGESAVLWAKFPAPPPDVKTVTLHVPGLAPFDDLQIQDK
jgi:hypothetical protein